MALLVLDNSKHGLAEHEFFNLWCEDHDVLNDTVYEDESALDSRAD